MKKSKGAKAAKREEAKAEKMAKPEKAEKVEKVDDNPKEQPAQKPEPKPEPKKTQAEKQAEKQAEDQKNRAESKPKLTYQILETTSLDEELDEVRVNVILTPPFNGFNEAVVTVPVPKGTKDKAREQVIQEKVAWKANQQVSTGAQMWTVGEAERHQDVVKETNGPAVIPPQG